MECYCDVELPDIFSSARPLARKDHRCDECGRTIRAGERYEVVSLCYDGVWSRYRSCVYCLAAQDLVRSRVKCFCRIYPTLWDDISSLLDYEGDRYPGLAFAIGRIAIESKRDR